MTAMPNLAADVWRHELSEGNPPYCIGGYIKNALKHPLRVGWRLIWLTGEIVRGALTFPVWSILNRHRCSSNARAAWLQKCCRRALRIFNVELQVAGTVPTAGLLVSNHLGYLDVLVLGALTPVIFVAKREVRGWPVFGWFARLAGTLFADRARRGQVGALTDAIRMRLQDKVLVVLFPEGTSSDGRKVLPFKSALFEPAVKGPHPLSVSFLAYRLANGDVGEELCYWKDMVFLPHLINLMSKKCIRVSVRFSKIYSLIASRKDLAKHAYAEVLNLKAKQM